MPINRKASRFRVGFDLLLWTVVLALAMHAGVYIYGIVWPLEGGDNQKFYMQLLASALSPASAIAIVLILRDTQTSEVVSDAEVSVGSVPDGPEINVDRDIQTLPGPDETLSPENIDILRKATELRRLARHYHDRKTEYKRAWKERGDYILLQQVRADRYLRWRCAMVILICIVAAHAMTGWFQGILRFLLSESDANGNRVGWIISNFQTSSLLIASAAIGYFVVKRYCGSVDCRKRKSDCLLIAFAGSLYGSLSFFLQLSPEMMAFLYKGSILSETDRPPSISLGIGDPIGYFTFIVLTRLIAVPLLCTTGGLVAYWIHRPQGDSNEVHGRVSPVRPPATSMS